MSTVDVFSLETDQSPYVPQQLPQIYRQNGPLFIVFLQAYYTWLGLEGNIDAQAMTLMLNRDVDTTLPEYLPHFEAKYLQGVPLSNFSDADVRSLVKNIKQIIAMKGSVQGIKYLFNSLYGEDVNIYRPGNDIFKTSDGIWNEENYIEVSYSPVLDKTEGTTITGSQSGATAYVYRYERRMLPKNKSSYLLYVSNISGTFLPGEAIKFSGLAMDQTNTPYIIGSLGGILVYQGGLNFNIGDNLNVFLDPTETSIATNALGVVSTVEPKNGVVNFQIIDGGVGYVNNTTDSIGFTDQSISLTQSNTNPGSGAVFQIGELSNTFNVTCSNDFILPYANIILSANAYAFPADPAANIATPLSVALNITTIEVGTINLLASVNPGAGYTSEVFVAVDNPVIASLHLTDQNGGVAGQDANITGQASFGQGAIANVVVKQSGIGYVSGEHLGLSSADNIDVFANGVAQIVGVGYGYGKWKNTQGFLDYDKYLQDSHYYQNYSYEIQSSLSPDQYGSIVKSGWHVAGTQMFGKIVMAQNNPVDWSANVVMGVTALTANASVFFTQTSADSYAQLSIDGAPVYDANVTSIHQTDWQGRVQLSNQPRAQLATRNIASSTWNNLGAPTITPGNNVVVNGQLFSNSVVVSSNSVQWYGLSYAAVPNTVNHVYTLSVLLATDVGNTAEVMAQVSTPTGHGDLGMLITYSPTIASVVSMTGSAAWGVSSNPVLTHFGTAVLAQIQIAPNPIGPYIGLAYVATGSTNTSAQIHPLAASFVEEPSMGEFIVNTSNTVLTEIDYTLPGYTTLNANAVPFMTGNGTANSGTLVIGAGGNTAITPVVNSIYQTDWQGRVQLSNAPRTNLVLNSSDATLWVYGQVSVTAANVSTAGGVLPYYTVTNNSNTGGSIISSSNVAFSSNTQLHQSILLRAGSSANVLVGLYGEPGDVPQTNCTAVVRTGPVVVRQLVPQNTFMLSSLSTTTDSIIDFYGTVGSSLKPWLFMYPDGRSGVNGMSFLVTGGMCEVASSNIPSVYIPTTTTPVTVTDYTQSGSQINLGQSPANNAVLDWAGTSVIPRSTILSTYGNTVSVQSAPFLIANGSANNAPLTIGLNGSGVVGTPVVTAMHQTDWQGRVALSNQERTNLLKWSVDFSNTSVWLGHYVFPVSLTGGEPDPTGGNGAWSIALSDATGSPSSTQGGLDQSGPVPASPLTVGIWMRGDVNGMVVGLGASTGGAGVLQTLTTAWKYYTVTPNITDLPSRIFSMTIDTRNNSGIPLTSRIHFFAPMSSQTHGVYIPTTTAFVTVTDYTQAGNQITFGQLAANGALLDWDGTATATDMTAITNDSKIQLGQTPLPGTTLDWDGTALTN